MAILDSKRNIRSFGRINGRRNTKVNESFLKEILEKYEVNFKSINKNNINHLEIGFGYGESLLDRAKNNKNIIYIGCETYTNGVLNLIKLIKLNLIENIKIFNGDARILLENIPNESLDKIFLLYPDPWPKKKQNKRRIINNDFLNIVRNKLKINGTLFFASDIIDYVNWTIEKFDKNNNFIANSLSLSEIQKEPYWWVKTKYQMKAEKENRDSYFLEFRKNTKYYSFQ